MASSVEGLVGTSVSIPFLLTSHPEHQALFDALVAAAAAEHGRPLYTRDRPALATYSKIGADYRLLD